MFAFRHAGGIDAEDLAGVGSFSSMEFSCGTKQSKPLGAKPDREDVEPRAFRLGEQGAET